MSKKALLLAVTTLAIAVALAFGTLFRRAGSEPVEEHQPSQEAASTDGHTRMLERLRQIRESTVAGNPWLGDGEAEAARRRLATLTSDADIATRWRLLREVGEHELRLGNEEQAIESFLRAYALLPVLPESVPEGEHIDSVFRLGLAYLRLGETRNCAAAHSPESCILPLRGGGVHADKEGSQQAIHYFEQVLSRTPRSSPLNLKTVWLLNFAYMTLGEYPSGMPEPYRMPEEILAPDAESAGFPRFDNVAPQLGVASFNLSGGAIVDDFDGDHRLDIFTTTFDTAGEPHLFTNLGDGGFRDDTERAGLRGLYGGLNAVHADYDNDGDLDLYVLRGGWLYTAGRHPNSLLRNDGGSFVDVTFEAGLGAVHYPTQTAAWADYDNDGDLDLYVGNEHGDSRADMADTTPLFEAPSQLFRNNGDGSFSDVAGLAGVGVRAFVKGVVWGDVDNDRYPDLYVSVLGGPNRLFLNNRDGTFSDIADDAGVSEPTHSFPVWFWDYDNDGNLDLFVSSYRGYGSVALVAASYVGLPVPWDLPRLYRGDGSGHFDDVSEAVGLDRLHLPMGSNFGDLDNDGFLDFYLGTGYPDYEGLMPNVLYWNRAGARFVDVTMSSGLGHLQKGHGVAFADVDSDGDQDIFEQMGGAFPGDGFNDALYENPGFGNHWLLLLLEGRHSNRAAIGARIRLDIVEGSRRRSVFRQVTSGGSFGGNPLRQTIGLGQAQRVESLEVFWPASDTTQRFADVPIDQSLRIVEGQDHWSFVPETTDAGGSEVATSRLVTATESTSPP